MGPEILAQLDERPRIGVLPDGTLMGFYVSQEGNPQEVRARTSGDGGRTWSAAETVFTLPKFVPPEQTGPPPQVPGRALRTQLGRFYESLSATGERGGLLVEEVEVEVEAANATRSQ